MTPRQISKRIAFWQRTLGLGTWDIHYSPEAPGSDERASCDFYVVSRNAVIRIAKDAPDHQIDRLVIHELGHILMAEMHDLFDRSAGDHQAEARAFLEGQWERSQEWVLERLASALTGQPRVEFGDDVESHWKTARLVS